MVRSRHRRARDLWLVRTAVGTAVAALAVAAALLVALADDPKLLRTAVVLALTGLALLGAMVTAGVDRGSPQLGETTEELARVTQELAAIRSALARVAGAPPGNGAIGRPHGERMDVDVGPMRNVPPL